MNYELPPGAITAYADRRNLRPKTRQLYAYVLHRIQIERPVDIIQWTVQLLEGAPLGTVLPYRAAVRLHIMHGMGLPRDQARDLVEQLPETRGRFPKRTREALTRDQMLQLVQIVRPWPASASRTILLLLPLTGLRISEATSLKIEHITPTGLEVHGKRGKTRKVPLTEATRALLDEWLGQRKKKDSPWVFPAEDVDGPIAPETVRKILARKGLKKTFGPHFSPHVLRHSWATSALRKKVDLTRIQELMGHENIGTTAKYLHLDPEARQEAMEAIEREILGGT